MHEENGCVRTGGRMSKNKKPLSILYIAICFLFFYVPILVTMIFSFNSSKSLSRFSGFSLKWYENLLKNGDIKSAVIVSLSIAIIATCIATILGTITAIGLSKNKKILKEWVLGVNDIPIMNPEIVTAIGLMIFFTAIGFEKGYITMLLAHIAFCTPYVITSVYPKVKNLDPNLANAAMDLGATPFQAITKVIVPMIKEGIYAGMLLSFTMSFDDFVISYFVTGNGVSNISIILYTMTKRANPTINALSTIVIVVIIAILLIVNLAPLLIKNKTEKNINKGIAVFGIVTVLILVVLMLGNNENNKQVLKVYNAGEYINKELIDEFEEEYDCTLIYETFDSNETMYTKVMSGEKYDIIIPSDYMIERFIKEEMVLPINWELIVNGENLMEEVKNRSYDEEMKYSAPYFWGTVGIIYDTTVVDEEDLAQGWEILRNTKYKGNIYMYDSERDSFMVALKALGYSMNTENEEEIQKAYEWLVSQRDTMNPVYAGDDVIDNMISGNKAMAVVYSGDAAYIMSENENLEYFTPEEGTNIWFDAMVIMNTSDNIDLAHDFIDFMLDEQVALSNSNEIGYSSPVKYAYDEMKDTVYEGISAYQPDATNENNEVFKYQSMKIKKLFADLWTKVKAY